MQIAIDTGGTFTDCVYWEGRELRVLKVRSTPANPASAVLRAVAQIAGDAEVEVRHGTTVGTNVLLERKGARVAFITTAGFEDTTAIGRQARPKLYDLFFQKEEPLAGKELRFGVSERVAADGSVLRSVEAGELGRVREAVRQAKPEAIAISLLFGFANPANEKALAASLAGLGIPISVSHEILPEFREYERGSTVLINAYLAPKMQSYLTALHDGLQRRGSSLFVMQSSGGITSAFVAAREPVRTILSGPAGGVVGAARVARTAGFSKILTFDMGGTSTDVALLTEGGLRTTSEFQILGMPVAVPMLDIHTVGAGGGSLASFDRGGALKVGPQSAGAEPGPICYGKGELPTVTDANLLLGRMEPGGLLGGGMPLDEARTRELMTCAMGKLATVERFAEGIVQVVDAHMVQALRKISVEQGYDPRDFVLVSFGGAGPLHACALARALRIPKVVVPRMPGALSAYGILISDVVRDVSRTVMLSPGDERLAECFADLGEGERSVDVRYAGQGYELNVPWKGDFVGRFHEAHRQSYGYSDEKRKVEVVNARVRIVSPNSPVQERCESGGAGDGFRAVTREKEIYCDGAWRSGKVYARDSLQPGDAFAGPSVVVEYSATTFIDRGAQVLVDGFRNLVITVTAG
jgi:N-methylhydantoinase A